MSGEGSELRRLWLAAADAADAVARAGRLHRQPASGIGRLVDDALHAELELRNHLLAEHGLTEKDLKRSVL